LYAYFRRTKIIIFLLKMYKILSIHLCFLYNLYIYKVLLYKFFYCALSFFFSLFFFDSYIFILIISYLGIVNFVHTQRMKGILKFKEFLINKYISLVFIYLILLQNVSHITFSHLHLWEYSWNAIPYQRRCTSFISSALLNV